MSDALGDLPTPLNKTLTDDSLSFVFDLDEKNPAFRGHFDGLPVLAGVVQVHWAMLLAADLGFTPDQFSRSPRVKFKQLVQPPLKLTYELARKPDGGFSYRLSSEQGLHSEGRFA